MNWPDDFINKVICGDCLDVMKEMPNECINITITSPPYNLGSEHHTGNRRFAPYVDNMPENEYQAWQINVLSEIHRLTRSDGSMFYFHKNRIRKGIQISPYEWIFLTSWKVKQELVWFNRSQNFDKIRFYPMTERVYWLVKRAETNLVNSINHHDLFQWNAEGTNQTHKRSFPERAVSDVLACFPDAELVFDPFLGSGTTCRAAKDASKRFIGIEIDLNYCKMAEARLSQGVLWEAGLA